MSPPMTDADMIEAMARVFSARDGIHELDHENRITRDFCSNLAAAALARSALEETNGGR